MHIRRKAVPTALDFQVSVKSDSISLPDTSMKSAKYHAGFNNSGNRSRSRAHCI